MGFSSLRTNSSLYVLHKDAPRKRVEQETVTSVTAPVPKYGLPQYGVGQEMVVDVTVRTASGDTFTYQKLPANLDVADFGHTGVTVAASRDAMNAEVQAMRQRSVDVLSSVDYNREVIADCDAMLQALNPELAEKQAQQEEIAKIKEQMTMMGEDIKQLLAAMRENEK